MSVVNFLLSLVSPLKMRRYRDMSVLIAIAIFLVSIYVLVMPAKIMSNNTEKNIAKNGYASGEFYNVTTDFDYNLIKINGYSIETVDKAYSLKSDVTNEVQKYTIACQAEANYNVYIVFDISQEDYDSELNIYEKYDLALEKDNFAMLFAKNYYELQTCVAKVDDDNNETGELTNSIIQAISYSYMNLTFSSYANTQEFLNNVATNLATLYGQTYVASYTLIAVLMVFVLPLLIVFIMWLLSRKTGSMKQFKEYYNMAAISSIVPILATFIVAWFYDGVINFYTTVFVIYYIFVIFKVNLTKDSVD